MHTYYGIFLPSHIQYTRHTVAIAFVGMCKQNFFHLDWIRLPRVWLECRDECWLVGSRIWHRSRQPKVTVTLLLPKFCLPEKFTVWFNLVYRASLIHTQNREAVPSSKEGKGDGKRPSIKTMNTLSGISVLYEDKWHIQLRQGAKTHRQKEQHSGQSTW